MSYVSKVLVQGETVEYDAKVSWVCYVPGLILLVIPPVGLILLLLAWIRRATTEIAVTDRRLIHKTGLIRRDAIDVERGRVETVTLTQSILGRMLDYGTVTVHGTGIGEIALRDVDSPMELRRRLSR